MAPKVILSDRASARHGIFNIPGLRDSRNEADQKEEAKSSAAMTLASGLVSSDMPVRHGKPVR
jgi:hypothetical protein